MGEERRTQPIDIRWTSHRNWISFQGSALYDSMTVRENLEFPLRRHTKKFGILKDTTALVKEALENVGFKCHRLNASRTFRRNET
jgi:ABC-type transporter Mla maintaining outer membrane lipid asymmetry ATPase subunit MlaF